MLTTLHAFLHPKRDLRTGTHTSAPTVRSCCTADASKLRALRVAMDVLNRERAGVVPSTALALALKNSPVPMRHATTPWAWARHRGGVKRMTSNVQAALALLWFVAFVVAFYCAVARRAW